MAQTKRKTANMVEQTTDTLRFTGRRGGLVEHVRDIEQYVDGSRVTGIHTSSVLPAEFAVLIDDDGRVDIDELTAEERAWIAAESDLEARQ